MSYRKQTLVNRLAANNFLAGPVSGEPGEVIGRAIAGSDISAALAELGVSTYLTVLPGDVGKVLKVVTEGTLTTMSWEFPYPETTLTGAILVSNGDNTTSWDVPELNFTGDATGFGAYNSDISLTLKNSGVVAGTYLGITVDSKGIVTSADASLPSSINFGSYEAGSMNVATLDVNGNVPWEQLPSTLLGTLKFRGVFDISTQASLPAAPSAGDYYIVSGVGTNPDGSRDYVDTDETLNLKLKDLILYTGDPTYAWVKVDNTEQVVSVNGKVGAVVLGVEDISGAASDTELANAVSTLQGNINAANTLISNLDLALDAEEAARIAADGTLTANLAQEVLDRIAGDAALGTLISSLQSSITNDINAAISTLQAGLSSETAARIAADSTLSGLISALDLEVSTLQSDLAAEVLARTAADGTLQANIDAEEAARIAADNALSTLISGVDSAVDAEVLARTAADGTLQANIDAEEAARIAADNALSTLITNLDGELAQEVLDRTAADSTLSGLISAEATLRTNADNALSTLISALDGELTQEVLDRTAADGTLQGNINALATLVANSANVLPVSVKTADYALTATDSTVAFDMSAASANITVTLPETPSVGQIVNIKRLGDAVAFDLIIDGFGSATIDGELTQLISYAWGNMTLQWTGSIWIIL